MQQNSPPPHSQSSGFLRSNAPWLGAGALLMFSSSYGQTFFISIFAGEIRAEYGLSDGQWGLIYTLGTTASALLMLWAGGLTDRLRARALTAAILPLLALACVTMAVLPVTMVWALPLVILALRFTGQGMTSHIATVAMARWFSASRGKALSIATMGFAFAEACLPLIFVKAMGWVDWRWLWVVAAGMALAAIPVIWRLLRHERTPQSVASSSDTLGMGGRHWTRAEALRDPLFWCAVPTVLGLSAFGTAFFFHQVHLAEVKGWTHFGLVSLFPIYTATAVAAMWLWGIGLDRLGTARLIGWYQIPTAIGFAVLGNTSSFAAAACALALMALSVGGNATLTPSLWAEFYGTRHLGAIKATAAAAMVLGSAIGPGLTGLLIDAGISFDQQMLGISAYFLASSALVGWAAGRARTQMASP